MLYFNRKKLKTRLQPHIYNGNKYYINKGFEEKIQISLAEISSSPNDEFKLVETGYEPWEFQCELCDHQHCMYYFVVLNLKTNKKMKVGSECINHFAGKGVDIDLATGLMKRVMKATTHARKELVTKFGKEAWKALSEEEQKAVKWYERDKFIDKLGREALKKLPREEKSKLTVNAFMTFQAEEILMNVSNNKHILSEEEIEKIISLGMSDKLEKAKESQQEEIRRENFRKLTDEIWDYFNHLNENLDEELDNVKVEEYKSKYNELRGQYDREDYIETFIKRLEETKAEKEKYNWLLNYSGNNDIVHSIISYLKRYGTISYKQEECAKNIIERESNPNTQDYEFEHAISILLKKEPNNSFFNSINNFYERNGYVTPKQRRAIIRSYKKIEED